MASIASVSSLGGPGGYMEQPLPFAPPQFSKLPNSLGGPGGYTEMPGITAQITQPTISNGSGPFGGMAAQPPMPFGGLTGLLQNRMPAPGHNYEPNPPISIPGLFANQQAMVGSGRYSGMQPSQMSPDFLSALSMVGLTPPATGPNGAGTPNTGLGNFTGGIPGLYSGLAGYANPSAGGFFGGNTSSLPSVAPFTQQPSFVPPLPFSRGPQSERSDMPPRRNRWGRSPRGGY